MKRSWGQTLFWQLTLAHWKNWTSCLNFWCLGLSNSEMSSLYSEVIIVRSGLQNCSTDTSFKHSTILTECILCASHCLGTNSTYPNSEITIFYLLYSLPQWWYQYPPSYPKLCQSISTFLFLSALYPISDKSPQVYLHQLKNLLLPC